MYAILFFHTNVFINFYIAILFKVEDQVKTLLECYKKRSGTEEENEERVAAMKDDMDARWQLFLQKFLSMQDQGNNFINSTQLVSYTAYTCISTFVRC